MEKKIFTVAIIGVGSRGGDTYGNLMHAKENMFKVVALCDKRKERLDVFSKKFGIEKENLFTDEDEFFKERRADFLVIATQDFDHVGHMLKAMPLKYDILVEKPLSADRKELEAMLSMQKKYGNRVLVCHVLRYAPAFVKCKELLRDGTIGKLVMIDALERVAYWHYAHSYVRGNWRKYEIAMPMILAKCCHDLDLIQDYAGAKCKTVSSVGDLCYFKAENAPENAADRCSECPLVNDCPYSAKRIYVERWHSEGTPVDGWPFNVITPAPVTEEKILKAIEDGPYGRCVYRSDNDVVDHQIVEMVFENGVKASLTMTGFTADIGRRIVFHGTLGEIVLDEETGTITVGKYGKPLETIQIASLISKDNGFAHGGGDEMLVRSIYAMLSGEYTGETSLEKSIESHLIGICAEESRKDGGKAVAVHKK